ncbi:MAG: hypothetical protein E7390_04055 [Ruminococcaceae bacterium]|nr:hypothetical protein [Oscillospiraceae bacterium]
MKERVSIMKKMLGLLLIVGMLSLSIIVSAGESWWMPIVDYISIGDKFNCTCSVHNGTHNGQDFPAAKGSAVRATKSGTVIASYNSCTGSHYSGAKESIKCTVGTSCGSKSMGNYVTLKHSDGTSSIYMHLSSVAVSTGTYVSQGQYLGGVGTTGSSTGNHLHFAIKNASGTYVNPLNYINTNNPGDYTEAPRNVSLSVNKSLYAAGETVTFTCAGTNVSGYTIGIDRDGTRIFTGDINAVYETSFTDAGTYSAYVSAWNAVGTVDSARVTFTVYNTVPTNVSVSTNKSNFSAGETITFTCTGTNAIGYTIGITKDGNRIFTGDVNAVYETSFSEPGSYAAYVTAWNSIGTIDSQWITFSVYAGAPYNPWIVADKTIINVGEEITFTFNAGNAAYFGLGIDKVGEGRVSSPNVGESNYYTTSFTETGTYSAYVTCYNSFGGCDSAPITFVVYNTRPAYSELIIDKTLAALNEEITFNCNSDSARRFAIGIDKNGERYFSSFITSGFNKSFSEAGEYTAYVTAENEYGSVDSSRISFVVYDSAPTYGILNCNKTIVKSGEEVVFNCNSDYARGYAIGIDKDGIRVFSSDISTVFSKSFSEPGIYTAYISVWNEYGLVDSPRISFEVYNSKPTYCNVETNKTLLNVGEEITFFCSSDYAERFDIGINKDGSRIFSSNITPPFNKSFFEPGTYTAYVTALNDYGSLDSSVVTFRVYNTSPIYCELKTDKAVVNIGEEITFKCNSDVGRGYGIGIYKNGKHIFGSDIGTEFGISFTEAGKYTADIATWNEYGIINSSIITFYVVDPNEVLSTHSAVTKENGVIQVSTEIVGQYENAVIFVAAYKEDRLTAAESYRIKETEREKGFCLLPETDSDTVMVYLWNPENLSPIGDAEVIPKIAWLEAGE